MEIAVATAVSGDETLLRIWEGRLKEPGNPEYDIHYVTAATIYGKKASEVTSKERDDVKPVNFGALYGITKIGMRKQMLEYGISLTEQEAQAKLDAFFATYPGLKVWFERCRRTLESNLYITHPYGRIRHIPKDSDADDLLSATNFAVQGWCASIMKECMNEIDARLDDDLNSHVLLSVHDEIIVETIYESVPTVVDVMDEVMNLTIRDKTELLLTATPEVKFNLSKGAKTYSKEGFVRKFLSRD